MFGIGKKKDSAPKVALPDPSEVRKNLEAAIKAAQVDLLQLASAGALSDTTRDEIIDLLMQAAAHLGAPHWMVSTQRIIGKGDWREHYQQGLALVEQAKEVLSAVGDLQPKSLRLIDLGEVKP